MALASIMTDSGGGVMNSKYFGVSHSPRKASRRRTDFRIMVEAAVSRRSVTTDGLKGAAAPVFVSDDAAGELAGPNGVESWASPALMAIEVWMHRRNGELWRTTSYFFRFGFAADGLGF